MLSEKRFIEICAEHDIMRHWLSVLFTSQKIKGPPHFMKTLKHILECTSEITDLELEPDQQGRILEQEPLPEHYLHWRD